MQLHLELFRNDWTATEILIFEELDERTTNHNLIGGPPYLTFDNYAKLDKHTSVVNLERFV